MQQQVITEQVKVQQIEKKQQVKVQEAEIIRHEKELIAKFARAPRSSVSTLKTSSMPRNPVSRW